jgi:phosphorylated adapter RNA export protein
VDYDPLPRPTVYGSGAMSMKYSDHSGDENDSVDSDSGDDSDSPGFRAKKPKLKKKCGAGEETTHPSSKQNKYNIWCSELQETSLTEELVNCDVRNKKFDRSRDVESYDYKLAYTVDDQQGNSVDSCGSKSSAFPQGVKRRYRDRGSATLRLGKRPSDGNESERRGSPRSLFELNVTVENTNEEVACDIANKLCEEKEDLICK